MEILYHGVKAHYHHNYKYGTPVFGLLYEMCKAVIWKKRLTFRDSSGRSSIDDKSETRLLVSYNKATYWPYPLCFSRTP